MTSYTEEDIRETLRRMGWTEDSRKVLMERLKENSHVHDFTDDDTISVKELKDAWRRRLSLVSQDTVTDLLKDISEHREPEYPIGTVWEDAHGQVYFRWSRTQWMKFGTQVRFADNIPARPLKRMDVTGD